MPGLRSLAVRRRSTRSPHGPPPSHPPHSHTSCQNKESDPHLTSFEHQERKDDTALQKKHEDCDQNLQGWRIKSKGSILQVLEPRVTPLTDVINPAPLASGPSDLTHKSSDITKYKDICLQENSAKQRSPSCESGLDLSFDQSKEEEEASRGGIEGECSKSYCVSGISGAEKVEVCCVDNDGFVCLGEREDSTMASVMERTSQTNRDSSSPCLQERIVIKMKLLPNSDMNKENNGKGLWLSGDCTTEGIVHKYTRWTIDSIINGEGHTRRGDSSWSSRSGEVKTEPEVVETSVSMLNGYDCSVRKKNQERNQCEWEDGIKKERLDYDENGYEEMSDSGGVGDDRRERDCYSSSRFFPYEINMGRKRTKSSSFPLNSSGGHVCKCTDRDKPDHKCSAHFSFSGSKSKNRSERENGKRVNSSLKKCSIIIKKVYTPNNESSYESSLCENSYDSPDEEQPAELEEASVVRPKRKAAVLAIEKCHQTLDSLGEDQDFKANKLLNQDEGLIKHFKKEPVTFLKHIKKEPEPFEHIDDETEGFWKPLDEEPAENQKVLDKEPVGYCKELKKEQVGVVTRLSKELLGQMKQKDKEPVGLWKQGDKEPLGLLKRMEKEPIGLLKGLGKESVKLLKQFDKEPVVLVRPVEKELAGLVKQISKESVGLIKQIKKEAVNIKQVKKEPVVSPKPVKPRRTRLSTCSIRTRSCSSELDSAHPSTPVTPQVQIINHSLPTQCKDKKSMFSPDSKQVLQCSVRLYDVFMNQFGRFICPSCDKPYNSNDYVCVNLGDLTMVFDCKKCFWVVKRRIATKEVQYLA